MKLFLHISLLKHLNNIKQTETWSACWLNCKMLQINEVAPAQLFEYSVMQLIISKIRKTFLRHKIESYVLCGPYLIVFNGSHLIMCQTYHRIKARSNLWGQIQGMSVIELQKKIILNTKQFLINRSYVIIKLIFI